MGKHGFPHGERAEVEPTLTAATLPESAAPMHPTSLQPYLDALGARTPAPASGSGAAVAGAIGAALAELAARFSDEREAASRLVELRTRLVELADEDAEAYTAFMRTTQRRGPRPHDRRPARDRRGGVRGRLARPGPRRGREPPRRGRRRGRLRAGREPSARVGARLVEINLDGADDPRLERARAASVG